MNLISLASFVVGMQMLRTNPMRTVLSTLGVIIGVASLVAILSLGDGLERFTREQIRGTTSVQTIAVQPRTTDNFEGVLVRRDSFAVLTEADRKRLAERLGGRASVVLRLTGSARLQADDSDADPLGALVTASTTGNVEGEALAGGRFFEEADVEAAHPVAVISRRAAEHLFGAGDHAVGRQVRIGGQPYRVVGVLAGAAEERMARVFVPLTADMRERLSDDGRRAPGLIVQVARIENVEPIQKEVEAWVRSTFGSLEGVEVLASTARAAQARQGVLVFKLALGSITGIAILVGGIGIMNVLLAAVSERTREIGVRRAAGARRADIFLQFIAESVAVSGLGSMMGVVLGLAGAFGITAAIRRFTEAPVYAGFTWSTVAVAALAAVLVGVAFGSYPARHAARLSPIEAIRHE